MSQRRRPPEIDLDSPIHYEPGSREAAARTLLHHSAGDLAEMLGIEQEVAMTKIRVCEARAVIGDQRVLSHQRVAPDVKLDPLVEREMVLKLVEYADSRGLILSVEDITVTWREEKFGDADVDAGPGGAGGPADAGAAAD